MMATGFLRVFTSMLLLLAMTATLVHQAGAATSTSATPTDGSTSATPTDGSTSATPTDGSTSATPTDGSTSATPTDGSTSASDCTAATALCTADADCLSCFTAGSSSAVAEECAELDFLSTAEDCDGNREYVCCISDASGIECNLNVEFLAYISCELSNIGCSGDFTCIGAELADSGATASLGSASTAIAFSCAVMATLALLWA